MPDFYESVAPAVFEPMWNLVTHLAKPIISRWPGYLRQEQRMFFIFSVIGVGLETVLGFLLFFPRYLPEFVVTCALLFNVFMHLYIIIFIGMKNGIFTFWCWNLMCLAASQTLFSPGHCLPETLGRDSVISLWHVISFLVFAIFPATVFFGRCPNGVLSHAYFAPGWYGQSFFLLPKRAEKKIPREVNRIFLPKFSLEENPSEFDYLLASFVQCVNRGKVSRKEVCKIFGVSEESGSESLKEALRGKIVIIDESWVDMTQLLGPEDPWKTFYAAGTDLPFLSFNVEFYTISFSYPFPPFNV
jgi:hypothetical protein